MIETVRLFDDGETELLKSVIGKHLDAFEAYLPFEGMNQAYKTFRLEFEGVSLDFSNIHHPTPLGPEGTEEELAFLSVAPSSPEELWCPAGKDITRCSGIDLTVEDVLAVVDSIVLSKGSIKKNKLKLVQAVAFREGPRTFILDRDVWFHEYLNLADGANLDALIRDCSGDWQIDPPYGYEFSRSVLSLGMGIRV